MITADNVDIEFLTDADLPSIIEIEKESGDEFSWTDSDFILTSKLQHVYRRKIVALIENKPSIVGYFFYKLHQHSIELLKLAVASEYRRQGYGELAINYIKDKLGGGRRVRLDMMLFETNLVGQLFLRSNGFRVRKICRQHFKDILEDSYLFSYVLPVNTDETSISLGE